MVYGKLCIMVPENPQVLVAHSSILTNNIINSRKIKIDINKIYWLIMIHATCKDYGFDCDFMIEGELEVVVKEFGKHTSEKHGIEYEEATLTKFMLNNNS